MTIRSRLPASIVTARLRLDHLRLEDADEMVTVLADERLYEFIGGDPPDLPTLRRRYAGMTVGRSPDGTEEWLNWIARESDGNRAVGTVQATVTGDDAVAELAWVVGAEWQGRGYGTEAAAALADTLRGLGIPLLIAHVHPEHAASEAVARGCGMRVTDVVEDGERRWEWVAAHRAPG